MSLIKTKRVVRMKSLSPPLSRKKILTTKKRWKLRTRTCRLSWTKALIKSKTWPSMVSTMLNKIRWLSTTKSQRSTKMASSRVKPLLSRSKKPTRLWIASISPQKRNRPMRKKPRQSSMSQ